MRGRDLSLVLVLVLVLVVATDDVELVTGARHELDSEVVFRLQWLRDRRRSAARERARCDRRQGSKGKQDDPPCLPEESETPSGHARSRT